MLARMSSPVRAGFVIFCSLAALWLAGCGVDRGTLNAPVALAGTTIRGNVHGGPLPIQGATVRLMETQSNGYGGVAKRLLQTTSDSNGYFTFPDVGWSCDSDQYAYITVTGGHTASQPNNNVGQIGVIGNCGKFLSSTAAIDAVQVYVSELSTVAAAYALRSFISVDNTNATSGQQIINISAPANNNAPSGVCSFTAPVSCTAAGLGHGFENAYNLVDSVSFTGQLPSGQARTAPPTNAFALVPQALINTLGNIMQSCVDSGGGTVSNYSSYVPGSANSSRCGDLFYWATPPGGTPPTNTLQAVLNMAQYPTNNASQLFALQPRAVFFTPGLSQAPNDLSVSIFYLTETFGPYTGSLTYPLGLTLDANDDAFILATSAAGVSNKQTAVLGLSTNGDVLFAGPVSTTYLNPTGLTADTLDNLWFTNNSATNGAVLKASPYTGQISVGTPLNNAAGVAVDRSNNVWVLTTNLGLSGVQRYDNQSLLGSILNPLLKSSLYVGTLANPTFDANQNLWLTNAGLFASSAAVFPNTGSLTLPLYPSNVSSQTLAGTGAWGIAPSASGKVYFPLANQLNTATYNGGMIANNNGTFSGNSQTNARYNNPSSAEVDGAGNVFWTNTETTGQVFQFRPPASGSMSQGTLTSLLPCYPINNTCYVPAVSNGRGMQIDSTGALWYVADAAYQGAPIGVVIQTLGVGAPTWPQISLGKPGTMPQ